MEEIASIESVAHVETIVGRRAGSRAPALLVEVPHGADRRVHYDALRGRMRGRLPDDLHVFFHANTDVGAWAYGRRVAERVIDLCPDLSALLVRCLIPRTFIDANRLEDAADDLAKGGMTAGVAPYVRDPRDVALLLELHRAYVRLCERAYARVCGGGGLALSPHTYGPRTIGIAAIDDGIVGALRAAHEPQAWASWPVRPEIDLITRDEGGVRHAPEGIVEEIIAGYRAIGITAVEGGTYTLHPSTQTYRWSLAHPGQVIGLEVRRDLLVETYSPFEEMVATADRIERIAGPLTDAIVSRLKGRRGV